MDTKVDNEQFERLRLGELAQEGLDSEFWNLIVKPIIDSMIKGLDSIREIKKAQINSTKKADILIEGRAEAINYISEIETLIHGYIADADTVKKIRDKKNKSEILFKETS